MKKWFFCLSLILTVLLTTSCSAQLAETPQTTPAGTEVIGTVNGENIYRYEYDHYFNMFFNEYFTNYYDLLLQYYGVDLLDEESSIEFLSDMEDFAWKSVVQDALKRQLASEEYGLSLEHGYYEDLLLPAQALFIKTNQLYKLMQEEAIANAEKDAPNYYQSDPIAWDCRKVAHIIIRAEQIMEENEEDGKELTNEEAEKAAKERAMEVIAKLQAGEDFAELAALYSGDGTAQIGGEMDLYFNIYGEGISEQQGFDPLFAEGAFLLKDIGDFSTEPVESSFGYHIIKLLDKKEGFEDVKEFMLPRLQDVSGSFEEKLQQMEKDATIERSLEFKYYEEDQEEAPEGAQEEE